MKRISLNAQARTEKGKGATGRLRKLGMIPTIVYGMDVDPVLISINMHVFQTSTSKLAGENAIFAVTAEGTDLKDQLTVIRDVQRDPVTERIMHLDLLRIDINKPIEVDVQVTSKGSPIGLISGGQLEHGLRSLRLRCLPNAVPNAIEVDISGLALNQSLHVRDLSLGEGIEIMSHDYDVLFLVAAPRAEKEEVVEAAAATPEVVGKKEEKKEEK